MKIVPSKFGYFKINSYLCTTKAIKQKEMDKNLEIARALYKPTPKVEALVFKLYDLFDKPLPNGATITSLTFKKGALALGGLSVKKLIKGGRQYCGIEVHWYPNFNISTTNDPFCSAFMLRYNSLEKLYREVEKVFAAMQTN